MVPQKVSKDGYKATKVETKFCFLEKVPIALNYKKIDNQFYYTVMFNGLR